MCFCVNFEEEKKIQQDFKLLDLEAKKEAPETPEKHNKVSFSDYYFHSLICPFQGGWEQHYCKIHPLFFSLQHYQH